MAEDVTKLPRWAQWKIRKLEQDLASARTEADAFAGTKTNIAVNPDAEMIRKGGYPTFLPDSADVEYQVTNGSIEISLRDGRLEILASGRGQLVVQPHSSNYIILHLIED